MQSLKRYWAQVPQSEVAPLTYLGIAPLLLAIYLNVSASGVFLRAKTSGKPYDKPQVLVMDGAFLLTRNPMLVLFLFGFAWLLGTLTPF